MKMRHAKILLILFLILLISCKGGDKGRMIHLGTWDHEKYGTVHVKFLKKSKTLQNYPCKRGKVRFHNNGQILSFKTTGEVSLDQGMVPSGSRIYTYPGGKPENVYLSTDTEIRGYKVSSRSRMLSWHLSLYCGGELLSFRSAVDLEIDSIPCSHKQRIELYPDGSLMSCHLSRAIPGKDNKYTAGTRIMMDRNGAPHSYSFPQHQAVSRLLNIEENLSEPLVRAYKARLNGRPDSALSIARPLQDMDYRNPLIHYELARIKRHRFIGGGKQTLENMLYSSRHTWVDQYNVILAFFHAESLLFAVRNNIKAAEEYRVADFYYEAINRFETVLEMKPDYHAARLHLVDLYSHLQDNQGGDREKAEAHAKELLNYDPVWAARAEAILLPENTGFVDFWLRAGENFRDDPMALQELGRAYLYEKDVKRMGKIAAGGRRSRPLRAVVELLQKLHYSRRQRLFQECLSACPSIQEFRPTTICGPQCWSHGSASYIYYHDRLATTEPHSFEPLAQGKVIVQVIETQSQIRVAVALKIDAIKIPLHPRSDVFPVVWIVGLPVRSL